MYQVSFQDVKKRDHWLSIVLPEVPQPGETIRFRSRSSDRNPAVGQVVRREWDVVERDPADSWVTVFVSFD